MPWLLPLQFFVLFEKGFVSLTFSIVLFQVIVRVYTPKCIRRRVQSNKGINNMSTQLRRDIVDAERSPAGSVDRPCTYIAHHMLVMENSRL